MINESWWIDLVPAVIILFGVLNLWIVAQCLIHVWIPRLKGSNPDSGNER
ncbi:MAG: hypothetical protein OXI71_06920 [Gemmatimonadota bacterium]|nr:hypothetical protein [Gemmatimonadota bacterium]